MPKAPPKAKRIEAPQPKRERWATSKAKRLSGSATQKARHELFNREPMCRICHAKGVITRATIRDHIKALALGGLEHPDNTQPLCGPCHDIKSRAEAIEGARRHRQGNRPA